MLGETSATDVSNRGSRGADDVATLTFSNISMRFPDGTEALSDVSFDVSQGEFVTIVGPSGCGKSTLLKIAAGLLDATSGTVDVDRSGGDDRGRWRRGVERAAFELAHQLTQSARVDVQLARGGIDPELDDGVQALLLELALAIG
ncbi:MAG: ATP-binding cassette domain-containing protein, partial [Actinobacteria bacterium]|nr:ATP-binding cassette domain-containing protein [Actinomycetota bacterium]